MRSMFCMSEDFLDPWTAFWRKTTTDDRVGNPQGIIENDLENMIMKDTVFASWH